MIYVQVRTLQIRYESLRIGQTDTEAISAASAAYVSASVTWALQLDYSIQ